MELFVINIRVHLIKLYFINTLFNLLFLLSLQYAARKDVLLHWGHHDVDTGGVFSQNPTGSPHQGCPYGETSEGKREGDRPRVS